LLDVIELRVLTPEDWAVWRRLRLVALAEAPYAFVSRLSDWQGEGDREERWRARLAIPGSHNLVAVLDGAPVGIASGVPGEQAGVATLISMWVSPQARGRGVADRLISEVERWALDTPAEVLRLAVTPGNEHAITLYRRNGFEDSGELGDLMPDGVGRERILSKKLR
jgi:ribosomal protein S18 acetylase RimI-like enzyme